MLWLPLTLTAASKGLGSTFFADAPGLHSRFRHPGDHYARMLTEMERWFGKLDNPEGLTKLLNFIHMHLVCCCTLPVRILSAPRPHSRPYPVRIFSAFPSAPRPQYRPHPHAGPLPLLVFLL